MGYYYLFVVESFWGVGRPAHSTPMLNQGNQGDAEDKP